MEEIGFDNKTLKLINLWNSTDLGEFNNSFSTLLDSHNSILLKAALIEPIPPTDIYTYIPTDILTDTPTDTDSGPDDKEENKVTIIVVSVVGGIIVICIGVIVYIFIRNRKEKKDILALRKKTINRGKSLKKFMIKI